MGNIILEETSDVSGTGPKSLLRGTDGAAHVVSANVTTKFRDAFEVYTPGGKWTAVNGTGDLVYVDGNAAAASYLVISKDPLTAATETNLTSTTTFTLPIEVAVGLSMSQRTLGQEFSVELVDTLAPLPDVADIAISSITQATTTLTVDTVAAHGLTVGKSIGIYGCSNQLANYPSLVVASVVSPTQFTATAGPGGTIASQTITNPAGAKGFVYFRERLGRAQNGVSQIFENATATNASLYIRSEAGDAYPSGTIAGNHSTTVGTTASVQLVNSAYQYTLAPTNQYSLLAQADRVQWLDANVDLITAQQSSRLLRTQVCPNPGLTYKLRIRAVNNKALTVPSAQVVSVTKSGTTTGTFVTATAHGLATGDVVVYYGSSDPAAANFPALVTATTVTVVNSTTFTAVIGTGTTGAAYGGFVAKVQGGNLGSALGYNAVSATSAVLSTLSDGTRLLTLTGSGTWSGLTIGDLVNVVGLRSTASLGVTSLGVDGAWKVADVATTTLRLVLPYSGSMSVPADFASTPCGGGVIKRTDMRISFVRVFDYARERVELIPRGIGDVSAATPVVINGGGVSVVGTASVQGAQANNATTVPNPVLTSIVGVSANPAAGTTARQQQAIGTLIGVPVTKPYSIPEGEWSYAAAAAGILNTTTAVTIKTAAGAGIRNYITSLQVMSEALTNATELAIRDGAAGTVIWRIKIPTGGLPTTTIHFPSPLKGTANTLLEVVTLTASGAGAVYVNAQGYAAP
ncbi:MAG: hypothetical protein ACO25M_00070 [Limnohabitans sp.]